MKDRKNWTYPITYGTQRGLFTIDGNSAFSLQRYAEFSAYLMDGGEPSALMPFGGYVKLTPYTENLQLLDLLSTKYIVVDEGLTLFGTEEDNYLPIEEMGYRFPLVYREGPEKIYLNPRALPKAYLVHKINIVEDAKEALRELASSSFDPWKEALLEEEPGGEVRGLLKGKGTRGQPAQILSYQPEEVILESQSDEAGLLILTDIFYPGWQAEVDGNRVPILRTNYLFRGVFLTPGSHTIRFFYRPESFITGSIISLLTMAFLFFSAVHKARKF